MDWSTVSLGEWLTLALLFLVVLVVAFWTWWKDKNAK
jgi:hypothetical protein